MKTIGIVCEGDRDYDMITSVICHFTGQQYRFLWLQPNHEFGTELGQGWKGVLRWCRSRSEALEEYLNGISPNVDLLIIQMDADVARCEAEVFCHRIPVGCDGQGIEDPLNCSIAKAGKCIQVLPPNSVCDGQAESRAAYLKSVLLELLNDPANCPVVVTIPCDSTDAWIVAAYEKEMQNIEELSDPWGTIIARKKDYHGVRIPGRKKSRAPYRKMIDTVCVKWESVKMKCPQARIFERCVYEVLEDLCRHA